MGRYLKKEDKEMSLVAEAQRFNSVKCYCTNRIPGFAFRDKEYVACNWCGRKVYKDKKRQEEYIREIKEECKKEMFRKEMRKLLCI